MKELKSNLLDRNLRFDGVSEIEPDLLARFLLLGIPPSQLRVTSETEEVRQMNEQVADDEQIGIVHPEPIKIDLSWQLPSHYAQLDLRSYIFDICIDRFNHDLKYDDELITRAAERVADELDEIEKRGMVEFMRTVIYILDELKKNKVVWGVGRGSSCASYLLFLIGLHVVDCVKMDVPMEEFYHE
jgi:DNA polymerase III alpha subunit